MLVVVLVLEIVCFDRAFWNDRRILILANTPWFVTLALLVPLSRTRTITNPWRALLTPNSWLLDSGSLL